ncbi:MAG: V-type ATPase subunit [Clostridia bacterium]|nr:V-type ATPase subunit [Clostridia bacterium]
MAKSAKEERYLCVSAYVRALESRLLTQSDLARMIDAGTNEECLRILSDHGYPDLRPDMATVEQALRESREELLADLATILPDRVILDLFRIRYDYHNVKVSLKALWTAVDGTHLLMGGGRLEPLALYHTLQTCEDNDLPDLLLAAVREARKTVGATGDPQKGDLILDRACFAEQLLLARQSDSPFLLGYVRLLTDMANLQTSVRVLRMGRDTHLLADALFPGGTVEPGALLDAVRTGDLTAPWAAGPLEEAAALGQEATAGGSLTTFEKACDDALTRYLQRAVLTPFGLEPVLAFIAAREQEQRNIRIIVSGRLAGLPADTIRKRMRESYV